ncbi:AraC family transcriptional regulator [Lachnospiraceae bacterium ASD3451]|uniref:AraC family transcriptional regulator n=1 Tax=Diplocloster agilis TaxID=2850323 RepID=UPI001D2300F0|nr:AraC family transcriptional regulator [Diplocloster agilis]MBU9746429.1 AraC family transcriptional regulator [Diplocloster agilis]
MYIKNDSRVLNEEFPLTIGKTPMTRQKHPPDFHHWHNFFEISYIIKGNSICHASGNYYEVSEGDIVIFNDTEVHGWNIKEDLTLLVLNFSGEIICSNSTPLNTFDSDYLKVFSKEGSNFQNILYRYGKYTQEIYRLMQDIYFEYTHEDLGKYLMMKADILKILTILTRNFQVNPTDHMLLVQRRQNLIGLEKVLNYINENFTEKITLTDAAEMIHMNASYLSSLFHRTTGETFKSYLTRLRIQKAHDMIIHTKENISTIAFACGFTNMANFYRLYEKNIGHPPAKSRI